MKIWLDDDLVRRPAPEGFIHVQSFSQLQKLLAETEGPIEVMDFDNDLGHRHWTGLRIIQWLAGEHLARYPREVRVHSKNIVDAPKILDFDRQVREHLV